MNPCNECGEPTDNRPMFCDPCIKKAYGGKK